MQRNVAQNCKNCSKQINSTTQRYMISHWKKGNITTPNAENKYELIN